MFWGGLGLARRARRGAVRVTLWRVCISGGAFFQQFSILQDNQKSVRERISPGRASRNPGFCVSLSTLGPKTNHATPLIITRAQLWLH